MMFIKLNYLIAIFLSMSFAFAEDIKVDPCDKTISPPPISVEDQNNLNAVSKLNCEELDLCKKDVFNACNSYAKPTSVNYEKVLSLILKDNVQSNAVISQLLSSMIYNSDCLLNNSGDQLIDKSILKIFEILSKTNLQLNALKINSETQYTQKGFLNNLIANGIFVNKDFNITNRAEILAGISQLLDADKQEIIKKRSDPKLNYFYDTYFEELKLGEIDLDEYTGDFLKNKIEIKVRGLFSNSCSFDKSLGKILSVISQKNKSDSCSMDKIKGLDYSFEEKSLYCIYACKFNNNYQNEINRINRLGISSSFASRVTSNQKSNSLITSNENQSNNSTINSKYEKSSFDKEKKFLSKTVSKSNSLNIGEIRSRINEISNKLAPIIESGNSISEFIPEEELNTMIDDLTQMKEQISTVKKKNGSNGKASGSEQIAERELIDALDRLEKIKSIPGKENTEVSKLKSIVKEMQNETATIKAQYKKDDERLSKLKAENDYLKSENLRRENEIWRLKNSAKISSNESSESVSKSTVQHNLNSNTRSPSSISNGNSNTVSSVELVSAFAAKESGSSEKIIITKSEYQSYPYKISENATDSEILNLLLKSKGNAILVGEKEQLIPELNNGNLVYDENGRPKYKIKKIIIKIVEDLQKSKADLSKLDQKEISRINLVDLNKLVREFK